MRAPLEDECTKRLNAPAIVLTTKLGPRLAEARANGVVEEEIHAPHSDRPEVINL